MQSLKICIKFKYFKASFNDKYKILKNLKKY